VEPIHVFSKQTLFHTFNKGGNSTRMIATQEKAEHIRQLVETSLQNHEAALVNYCAMLLGGDIDRARDVVQDAFLRLCHQDPDLVEAKVRAWLFTVCRNRAYDVLRKDRRLVSSELHGEDVVDEAFDPARASQLKDMNREVLSCVSRLPESQRDVILLRYQQSLSYKEISEITGLGIGNVGFLLHTALKRLRAMLDSVGERSFSMQ